ncbi:hypothetical protein ACROYT_G038504 [Oculina patagonica]
MKKVFCQRAVILRKFQEKGRLWTPSFICACYWLFWGALPCKFIPSRGLVSRLEDTVPLQKRFVLLALMNALICAHQNSISAAVPNSGLLFDVDVIIRGQMVAMMSVSTNEMTALTQ